MRKRIALCMAALVLALLGPGMALVVSRSFGLTMERERARALGEEAAIARAVALETASNRFDRYEASTLQTRYSSKEMAVYLLRDGEPITGEALPEAEKLPELLNTAARATLLDRPSERLLIAHALGDGVLLLAAWISGLLIRPLRQLSDAAARLTRGEYDAPLPTAQNDEIGALIRAFSGMSGAIGEREAALRAQAEERQALIDALAHEMRTPLTAILGGARLLGQSKLSEGQQSELLDMMAREAARLSTMDERLLLLTRLGHERPEWTTFDSRAMAEEALRVFDGVRLEGEGAAFVGERELTILLLRNLVVNAQRAGGEAPVCVTLHPDGFDVTDCGCGMTEEQLAHAFEPFYKADKARTRGAGGAGLGLSLCRKIARLHRGDVRIESEIGKGTRVCYRFDTSL